MARVSGQGEVFLPLVRLEFDGHAECRVGAERVVGKENVALICGIDAEYGVVHRLSSRPHHVANHPNGIACGEVQREEVRHSIWALPSAFARADDCNGLVRLARCRGAFWLHSQVNLLATEQQQAEQQQAIPLP